MTYRELLGKLMQLKDYQLDMDLIIYDDHDDKIYPGDLQFFEAENSEDMLDDNQPMIVIRR